MPSISEVLFKQMGLTQWGREPDFVAPKPLTPRQLRKLGDALDVAESLSGPHGHRYMTAFGAYGEAVAARKLYLECKFENSKRVVKSEDKLALDDARYYAEELIDEIVAARPEYATAREFIDANAAFMLAQARYEIAERKFNSAEAVSRRRDSAYRFAVRRHARLVSDGYVKTGKFVMLDGERVPVLEKVE